MIPGILEPRTGSTLPLTPAINRYILTNEHPPDPTSRLIPLHADTQRINWECCRRQSSFVSIVIINYHLLGELWHNTFKVVEDYHYDYYYYYYIDTYVS